jgi:uncharacterized coiled-coil protein SlyX
MDEKPRTIEMVNQEYTDTCAKLGDLIVKHRVALDFLKKIIDRLQTEFKELEKQNGPGEKNDPT